MQRYTIEIIKVDNDGNAMQHNEADAFYPVGIVDAEIAGLKAEIEGLVNDHNLKDINIAEMREKIELHKAALRWCLENGAMKAVCAIDSERYLVNDDGRLDCQPEYAPLIAEAVKP